MPDECNDASVLIDLNAKMEKLMHGIDSVKEKQDTMAHDVVKIKEAVYNPDEGLYARLRELEAWKKNSTKLIWIIVTAMIGLTAASFWNLIISP
tara:strand:- start:2601 stop:2882 length:282 start_codon:yes stop_codon:yes gene_type:complete